MAVVAVVGAQYGSEGKGNIVNSIAGDFPIHVRVGGPNAGHSFYHEDRLWKMQSIPCGWTNPTANLVIGRGALVNPVILEAEIKALEAAGYNIRSRLFIDYRAGVLDPKFHEQEGGVEGEIHQRIGSTGEGVGAARMARMSRDASQFDLVVDAQEKFPILGEVIVTDTVHLLNTKIDEGADILLEGTQGSALSLIHGPWPYVTSADTNAATMAADVGIAPHLVKSLLVARTQPIRVAGNSGELKDELTWVEMARRLGRPVEERTTVTNKTRRIGKWDETLFRRAVMLNRPHWIAVTFLDYLNPEDEGVTLMGHLSEESIGFIDYVESLAEAPVVMAGTGGDRWNVIKRFKLVY